MTSVEFPLIPGKAPVQFRFTFPMTRQLESAAGCGIELLRLRGQLAQAITLMTCYGLKWDDPKMTEAKAERLIQTFIDSGGDVNKLSTALVKAMNESGVYGEAPEGEVEESDPLVTTTETPTT